MAVLETGDLIVYGALKKYVDEHGGGAIDWVHDCTASEIDEDGYPIYDEIVKTVGEDKMEKMLFTTPNGTNKFIVWLYRNGFFDPINSAELVIDKLLNVSVAQSFTAAEKVQGRANIGAGDMNSSDHKANEIAITDTYADGTTVTYYVHTTNE